MDSRYNPPAIYLVDVPDEFPHFRYRRQNDSDVKYIRSDIFVSLYKEWLRQQEVLDFPPLFTVTEGQA